MRIFKISLILVLFFMLSCKGKEELIYPPSDNDSNTADDDKSDIGEPCKFSSDCLPHLKCEGDVCVLDVSDEDFDKADPDIIPDDVTDDIPDTNDFDETDIDPVDVDIADIDIVDVDISDDDIVLLVCGNAVKEPGEECDNGEFNSDLPGDIGQTCRTNCKYAGCGDNIIDIGEMCDDGNITNGDYCDSTCSVSNGRCGDGIVQTNEACDKSPLNQGIGSYCSDDCKTVVGSCGDGIQQDNEACDKGETGDGIGPYYCAADCKTIIGACGDTIQQANETCDDGENNGRYNYCNATCNGRAFHCGDGVKDYGYEACDDGNDSEDDYCTNDCMTELGRCGDGIIQANEACDNAVFGAGTGAYCSSDCKTVLGYCGDETTQTNEQCDWGHLNGSPFCEYGVEGSCNKCNSVCNLVPGESTFCGDGKVDTSNGETCDKAEFGNGIGAYCSFDCKSSNGYCGDGAVQSNEACDKAVFGDGTGPEYCAADCKSVIGYCGDGTQQTAEQCDNGINNTDKCPYGQASCTVCNSECKSVAGITSTCGDSRTDSENGEFCDSGSNNGKYKAAYPGYCDTDCKAIGSAGYCGDENIQSSYEQCDNGSNNGNLNCDYGQTTCSVCTSACTTASGSVKYCGDGTISDGEICDDGVNNGSYGYCKSDCTGEGPKCGDGITNGSESCDDGELNGTYGKCAFDCSGSGPRCGDGIKQADKEFCDDGADNGTYRLDGPGNCNADCQGIGAGGYCGNGSEELSYEQCDNNGVVITDCEYGQTSCLVCNGNCQEVSGNAAYCGDDVKNGEETCDDGVRNGSEGYCNSTCNGYLSVCGNGVKEGEEACDDGAADNGSYGYCNASCTGWSMYCGDSIKNGPEVCDDGGNNGAYGYCKADCTGIGLYCGDNDINGTEVCDDGLNNGLYGYCKSDCTGLGERCGDGIENGTESCDDGINNGTYGYCKADCSGEGPYCGDDVVNGTEFCDDGANNGNYGYCNFNCSAMNSFCGDGILNNGEVCDDGELNGTYGKCNTGCTGPGLRCGDGVKNGTETCDDGILNGTYGHCLADCSGEGPYCGDGTEQHEENCDDGGLNGTYGKCKTDCTGIGETCGDGIKNGPEVCDDGGQNGTPGYCKTDCTGPTAWCGDGTKNGSEQCDNGSNNGQTKCPYGVTSCKVCSTSCIESNGTTSYCGNSQTDSTNGEACDQGSNNGKYKASFPGYCNSDCKGYGTGGYCGDSATQSAYEQCDKGSLNGTLYCDYGLTSCNVCKTTCTNTPGIARYCGDGIKQDEELCDDGSSNGLYKSAYPGYCNTGCQGKGNGGYCGDSTIQVAEQCDSGINNGVYGFCKNDCSGLGERCGDGLINGPESCDDGIYNGQYDPSGSGTGCNESCSGDESVGYCGDGETQADFEECDDGFNNGSPGFCSAGCVDPCGNGTIDVGEFCDTEDVQCSDFAQFSSGTATCLEDCIPDFSTCVENPAYISPFFTTSITDCYDNTGVVTCPDEGNPFYGQEPQFDYAVQDFTVGNDVITENISGLMWQKETPASYSGCTAGDPVGSECTLIEADEYCRNLTLSGYDDWRFPTSFEMTNIINYEQAAPNIFSDFVNTLNENYLSYYHFVSFIDGTSIKAEKSSIGLVKCVRGEDQFSGREILQSGDLFADVLDRDSGIMVFWQYDSAQIAVDWEDALAYCSAISEGGVSGFRLPTIVELQSFAFESITTRPPYVGSGIFWTSTTVHSTPASAYSIDFATGNVQMSAKTGSAYVICVK